MRNILGNPVPKVYAWSSNAKANCVGAEYIIMEKLPGVELEHVWPSMGIADRFAIVQAIAEYPKTWTSLSFTGFGSLYYSGDLDRKIAHGPLYTDQDGVTTTNAQFVIGPSIGLEFFDHGRAGVHFDTGPCKTVLLILFVLSSSNQRSRELCSRVPLRNRGSGNRMHQRIRLSFLSRQ